VVKVGLFILVEVFGFIEVLSVGDLVYVVKDVKIVEEILEGCCKKVSKLFILVDLCVLFDVLMQCLVEVDQFELKFIIKGDV
jgi:hypothetical protein